jgi:hypothetical protein
MRYFIGFLFLLMSSAALAEETSFETLSWDDLMPEGGWELYDQQMREIFQGDPIQEGSAQDQSAQLGTYNVVDALDGKSIRLPGFVIPFEYGEDQTVSEFLLVPYFGACIHSPPPPPNQIVFVTTENPVRFGGIWTPIWASGTLKTERNENGIGNAAYTLHLENWTPYGDG